MSEPFVKIVGSLPESTIWTEPLHVRVVWITMLCTCTHVGEVHASVPGLAKRANVTLEQASEAIDRLSAPDPHSRTPDHDGRRIEPIAGGWRVLNYQAYRARGGRDPVKDKARKRAWWHANKARYRAAKGEPAAAPVALPAAAGCHSTEAASQAIQESKRAAESAAPMPEHIRRLLGT